MKLSIKLLLYIILIVVGYVLATMGNVLFGPWGGFAIYLIPIAHFWFMFVVYNDAKAIKVNENWWVLVLFLGPLGGIIYYLVTDEKRKTVNISH